MQSILTADCSYSFETFKNRPITYKQYSLMQLHEIRVYIKFCEAVELQVIPRTDVNRTSAGFPNVD